jgi:hypothetical protein
MRTLQRFLLVALLTGLVVGCKSKSQTGSEEVTPAQRMSQKIEQVKQAPEPPQLRP